MKISIKCLVLILIGINQKCMKKIIGLFVLAGFLFSSFLSIEQGNTVQDKKKEGIVFSDLSFEEALKEADKTGKLIFLDAYTDWCGPCKAMSRRTFTDVNVGELFNSKFINLKVEMEKNPIGPELARRYGVRSYPSMFFINGKGKVVKKIIGYHGPDDLLAVGKSVK